MKKELKSYKPLCDAISKLFYPNVEVVMHDVITKKLVYISNAFSKRRVGDSMINDIKDFSSLKDDWIGPYDKVNDDGKKLKAVSTIIKNTKNEPIGLICINYNIEPMETLFDSLKGLLNFNDSAKKTPILFSQNWKEHTTQTIERYLNKKNISLSALSTPEKKELIFFLYDEGIFEIRNVVTYVCNILNISRATLYNWLKEKKK
jgi:predicted transcriptional regulator YheO